MWNYLMGNLKLHKLRLLTKRTSNTPKHSIEPHFNKLNTLHPPDLRQLTYKVFGSVLLVLCRILLMI